MKKTLIALLAATTVMGTAPLAMAAGNPAPQQQCQGKSCGNAQNQNQGQHKGQQAQKPGNGQQQQAQKPGGNQQKPRQQAQHSQGPQRGDSARSAPRPSSAQLKKLPSPPKGQEYRILNDRVVRVDSDTLAVVAVAGLVTALLAN